MGRTLRASHSNIKHVTFQTEGSKVTDMSVVVSIDYINDDGDLVTSVDDTVAVWAALPDETKQMIQAIVDGMAAVVDAKYF